MLGSEGPDMAAGDVCALAPPPVRNVKSLRDFVSEGGAIVSPERSNGWLVTMESMAKLEVRVTSNGRQFLWGHQNILKGLFTIMIIKAQGLPLSDPSNYSNKEA